jgi:hypothetical protein
VLDYLFNANELRDDCRIFSAQVSIPTASFATPGAGAQAMTNIAPLNLFTASPKHILIVGGVARLRTQPAAASALNPFIARQHEFLAFIQGPNDGTVARCLVSQNTQDPIVSARIQFLGGLQPYDIVAPWYIPPNTQLTIGCAYGWGTQSPGTGAVLSIESKLYGLSSDNDLSKYGLAGIVP